MLAFVLPLVALADGTPTIPATQAEVNAGTIHNKYVAPDTLKNWTGGGGGGATNGLLASDLKASLESGTNNYKGTNVDLNGRLTVRDLVVTNGVTNLFLTASRPMGTDANKKVVSIAQDLVTNLQGAAIVVTNAGVNTTITTNAVTTPTINADTANFAQANIANAWLTNTLVPTNAFVGTVVDFNKGWAQTNIGGNLTFTDVTNATAGAVNTAIRRVFATGADRTLAFPAGWHTNYNFIGVVTNGWQMDLLVTVTAERTNVAQILYP